MKISKILILSAAALSLTACGEHTHSFASEWTYDETNHWHAATCEHTEEKSGVAAHTLGADGKCTVCDYTIPKDNKVTKEEWEAAFDLDKPYYMADNYNAVMRMIMEDETVYPSSYLALQVDGLKAKLTNKEVCTHEEEQFYVKVNNVYNAYLYGQKRENKWDLFENVSNPARNFANFLEPIVGTYSSFTYNQNDSTYKCVSLDYEGTILTNVSVKFVDKKVVNASFDSTWGVGQGSSTPFHWTFEIVYGGQTVTLPEVEPGDGNQPKTREEYSQTYLDIADETWSSLDLVSPIAPKRAAIIDNRDETTVKSEIDNIYLNGATMGALFYMLGLLYTNDAFVLTNDIANFDVTVEFMEMINQNYKMKSSIDAKNNKVYFEALVTAGNNPTQYSIIEADYDFAAKDLISYRFISCVSDFNMYVDMGWDNTGKSIYYEPQSMDEQFVLDVLAAKQSFVTACENVGLLTGDFSNEVQSYNNALTDVLSQLNK